MHPFIRTLPAWLNKRFVFTVTLALISQACASRAPSLRVLDTRAGYGSEIDDEEIALYERAKKSPDSLLKQGGHKVVTAYIYPHELPTKDYFWGAYVSLIAGEEAAVFENPEDEMQEPGIKESKKTKKHNRNSGAK